MIKVKLGDIIDVKRGAAIAGEFYASEGALIRLTLGNFNYPNGGFKENTSKDNIYYVGKVKSDFILNKNDIITPLTEQTPGLLGETAKIPISGKYIQTGDIGLVKVRRNDISDAYIYYLLSSKLVKKQIGSAAQQTKIRHTSPDKIKECIVWIPKYNEQVKIAKVIDDINDKINNNLKINDNLRAIQ